MIVSAELVHYDEDSDTVNTILFYWRSHKYVSVLVGNRDHTMTNRRTVKICHILAFGANMQYIIRIL